MMRFIKYLLAVLLLVSVSSIIPAQETKFNPQQMTEEQIKDLDKVVDLDDFQKLELEEFLLDGNKKLKIALEGGMDEFNLRVLVENHSRELDNKLKEILIPEQFDKYMQDRREKAVSNVKSNKKK